MSDPAPVSRTEAEIRARLESRPDLLERFDRGDLTVLAELLAVGLGTDREEPAEG